MWLQLSVRGVHYVAITFYTQWRILTARRSRNPSCEFFCAGEILPDTILFYTPLTGVPGEMNQMIHTCHKRGRPYARCALLLTLSYLD